MKILRRSLSLALAGLSTLVPPAMSADASLDSAFVSEISPGLTPAGYPTFDDGTGAVNAVALQSGGQIIAGGNVSRYKTSGALTALKRLLPTGALDTTFNSTGAGLAANSGQPEVNALLVDSADRIYVGGTFDSYNGTARSGILRLLADGSLDPDFNLIGLGGGNRFAQTLALQPDGKLLVGGTFASINGNGRSHLARLNSDGTLDFTFTAFSAFSSTFTSSVRDIALLPDGRILVAGLNTASQPVLIRLQANGTLDASFNPGLVAATGAVNKLLLLPDGRVLAAGFFTPSATGQEVDLAAFQADGTLDSTFLANLGDGPNGSVLDLKLQPDGTILASGVFNLWNGQPRASLARLSLTGELLASPAPAPYTDNRDNENITPFYLTHFYSLAVQPDGKLVAGGWFSRVTDPALETYNLTRFVNEFSASAPGAIRLLSATASTAENTGSVTLQVSRFGGTSGAVSVQFATSTGGSAGTATAGSDYTTTTGTLSWAAGEGGYKTVTVPVLQDTASESPETFTVTLSGPTGGATVPAANAKTVVTVRDDDSAPFVTTPPASASVDQGARLTLSVGFDSVLPATLRWQRDPDGSGPLGYSDLSDGALISGTTSATLLILAADPALHSGAYRVVLTNSAGSTNSAAATVAVNIPAGSVVTTTSPIVWNRVLLGLALDSAERPLVLTAGLSGSDPAQLRRLVRSSDATPQINFEPNFNTATFTQVSGSLTSSGSPTALLVLPDGKILVGGYFTHVNGSARPTLARFAADGLLDSAYAPALPTVNLGSTITSVVLAPGAGGKFYAGFDTNGGLRRYAADGTLDTGFAPNTNASFFGSSSTNNSVTAILEASDGKVYVAHRFSTGGFGAAFQYLIWRLNPDGTRDTSFVSPTPNFTVTSLALLPDGRLAFAGLFQSVNSLPLARLAIANPDGSLDAGFFRNPNFLTGVNKLFYRDGRLLVVGEYQNTVTTPRAIARYNLDGTLDSTFAIGEGANGRITGAAFTSSGELLVVGGFSQIKGVSRDRLAYLVMNPQIGAVSFAPTATTLIEGNSTLTLNVRRYGSNPAPVSVRWATAGADTTQPDTSATAGVDYVSASGTLSWGQDDFDDKT
ncbi:MAG: hypothetical protein MUE42_08820, partial [Opitutaceae bacterium]|nr:hypothetical protein [Opitutaceae bacterium]